MLTDAEKEEKLATSPAPRVTKEYMESRIAETTFTRFTGTVTICNITLDNGYSVRGESACVSSANYNQEIGEKIAYDMAFNKLMIWLLTSFGLCSDSCSQRNCTRL